MAEKVTAFFWLSGLAVLFQVKAEDLLVRMKCPRFGHGKHLSPSRW
jgi:hypothetical protein